MDSANVAILRRNFSSKLNMFSEPRAALVDSSYSSGLRVTYYVTEGKRGQNPKKAFRNVSFHVVILGPGWKDMEHSSDVLWKYERKPADNGPN